MSQEYCLVCAAHGRKVAAVRIDYPQGDRVDYKCPVCPYATALVSETDVSTVLSMRRQIDDDLLQGEILQREVAEKITSGVKIKKLKQRLGELLGSMTIPVKRRNPFDLADLTRLVNTLGKIEKMEHENYPEAMELVNELLRLQQKENDNV